MNFWRSQYWLEYLLHSKIEVELIDRSLCWNGVMIPLIQEGQELYSPGFDDNKEILQRVREIALDNDIKRIQVDSQIKSYLNISGYTCVINPFEINPTKGHKSAIKLGQKYLKCEQGETSQFMRDYFEIAGKITRPEKTFEILQTWIERGYGSLLKATCDGKTAGYVYILHYDGYAYYFMSGVFPEYRQYSVTHFLQAEAFELLKRKGITRYELGEQYYNSMYYCPSEKDKSIALFKRGFGGGIEIKPRSEYFFDADYMRKTMNKRIENYIKFGMSG